MAKLDVKGTSVAFISGGADDYISLTDIARYKDSERTDYIIQNWLWNRNTIEFLGIWEQLNNPDFNPIKFDGIRNQAGLNSFVLTAKHWMAPSASIHERVATAAPTPTRTSLSSSRPGGGRVQTLSDQRIPALKETEYQQLGWDIRRNRSTWSTPA